METYETRLFSRIPSDTGGTSKREESDTPLASARLLAAGSDSESDSESQSHWLLTKKIADLWEGVQRRKRAIAALGSTDAEDRHPFRIPDPLSYYFDDGTRDDSKEFHESFREIPATCKIGDDGESAMFGMSIIRECMNWICNEIMSGRWLAPDVPVNIAYSDGVARQKYERVEKDDSGDNAVSEFDKNTEGSTTNFEPSAAAKEAGMSDHDSAKTVAGYDSEYSNDTTSGTEGDPVVDGDQKFWTTFSKIPDAPIVTSLGDAVHVADDEMHPLVSVSIASLTKVDDGPPKVNHVVATVESPRWAAAGVIGSGRRRVENYYRPNIDASLPLSRYFPWYSKASEPSDYPYMKFDSVKGDVYGAPDTAYPPPANAVDRFTALRNSVFGSTIYDELVVAPWPAGTIFPRLSPFDSYEDVVRWSETEPYLAAGGDMIRHVVDYLLECLSLMTRYYVPWGSYRTAGSFSAKCAEEYTSTSVTYTTTTDKTGGSSPSSTADTDTRSGSDRTEAALSSDMINGTGWMSVSAGVVDLSGAVSPFTGIVKGEGYSDVDISSVSERTDTDSETTERQELITVSTTYTCSVTGANVTACEPVVEVPSSEEKDSVTFSPFERLTVSETADDNPPTTTVEDRLPEGATSTYLPLIPLSVKSIVSSAAVYAVVSTSSSTGGGGSVKKQDSRTKYTGTVPDPDERLPNGELKYPDGLPPPFSSEWYDILENRTSESAKSYSETTRRYESGTTSVALVSTRTKEGTWTCSYSFPEPRGYGEDPGFFSYSSSITKTALNGRTYTSSGSTSSYKRAYPSRTVDTAVSDPFVVIDFDFSKVEREETEETSDKK